MLFKSLLLGVTIVIAIGGCARGAGRSPLSQEPIGLQMQRADPQLKDQRFAVLLDFERPSDAVFVVVPGGRGSIDRAEAHTGRSSLRLDLREQGAGIRLESLLAGREFPGRWTLLGLYVNSTRPGRLNLALQREGRTLALSAVPLAPGQWTAATVDLAALMSIDSTGAGAGATSADLLVLQSDADATLWIDDLVLIDNARTIVADPSEGVSDHWSIMRKGNRIIGEARGRFRFSLASSDPDGISWQLHEANELRARFESADGSRQFTLYADGRAYRDGKYEAIGRPAREMPELASGHVSPLQLSVPAELGRLERRTSGDANNDGYNEARGAYQIQASGPRLEVQLAPQSAPVLWPVLEISGLPEGKLLVTVEGRLVERLLRLESGEVLVILPVRIERPTTVNIRVQ